MIQLASVAGDRAVRYTVPHPTLNDWTFQRKNFNVVIAFRFHRDCALRLLAQHSSTWSTFLEYPLR